MIHNDTLYRASESNAPLMVCWSGNVVKVERGDERLADIVIPEESQCTVRLTAPMELYTVLTLIVLIV